MTKQQEHDYIIDKLNTLSSDLIYLGAIMKKHYKDTILEQHGEEMLSAGLMAKRWRDEILN